MYQAGLAVKKGIYDEKWEYMVRICVGQCCYSGRNLLKKSNHYAKNMKK